MAIVNDIWVKSKINLGEVKEKTEKTIVFRLKEGIKKEVKNITLSCGCSSAESNDDNGTITVKFKSGELPIHIKRANQHVIATKNITVEFEDGDISKLEFTATIIS